MVRCRETEIPMVINPFTNVVDSNVSPNRVQQLNRAYPNHWNSYVNPLIAGNQFTNPYQPNAQTPQGFHHNSMQNSNHSIRQVLHLIRKRFFKILCFHQMEMEHNIPNLLFKLNNHIFIHILKHLF